MAQAPVYTRTTDFAEEERDNVGGRSTVRTDRVNAELDALGTSANALRANQALNQRDDGEIRDQRVKLHTLAPDVLALLVSVGAVVRGAWLTATDYSYKDIVQQSGNTYIAVVAHTSGVFATDLAADKWLLLALGSNPTAAAITFISTGTIAAGNVQAAIEEVDTDLRALVAALIARLADSVLATNGPGMISMNDALAFPAGSLGKYITDLVDDIGSIDSPGVEFVLDLETPANARTSNLFERGRNIVFATDIGVASPIDPTFAVDSTAGLNQAFAETRGNYGARPHAGKLLVIPPGNYKVSGQLTLGTNQHIWFMPGVTIDASATTTLGINDVLFAAANQDSVHLYGNGAKIIGNRTALAAAGETVEGGQFGFFFYGTVNFSIRNFRIYDFWTEGIMIDGDATGSGPCENGLIEECFINNCRRNGGAVTSAKGLRIIGGQASNNNGNPAGPNAGWDIEPNPNCYIEGVQLIGVRTFNNLGGGIWLAPGPLTTTGSASDMYQVEILGGHSYNDGTANVVNAAALQFIVGNGGGIVKKLRGGVTVRDYVIESPLGRGVSFYNWDSEFLPRVLLDNVQVYDPNFAGSAATNANKAGFVIYADSTQTSSSSLGNITLRNCFAEDRRGTPQMTWGFLLAADGSKKVKDVAFTDCYANNFTATDKSHVSTQSCAALNGNTATCSVNFTTPASITETGSRNLSASGGMRLRSNANALEFTLPFYLSALGMAYEVYCAPGVTAATVKIDAVNSPGDRISLNGAALATSISVPPGSVVRLRCTNASDAVYSASYTQ